MRENDYDDDVGRHIYSLSLSLSFYQFISMNTSLYSKLDPLLNKVNRNEWCWRLGKEQEKGRGPVSGCFRLLYVVVECVVCACIIIIYIYINNFMLFVCSLSLPTHTHTHTHTHLWLVDCSCCLLLLLFMIIITNIIITNTITAINTAIIIIKKKKRNR